MSGGGWIKPLQTLSQGLVLTLRFRLALSLTISQIISFVYDVITVTLVHPNLMTIGEWRNWKARDGIIRSVFGVMKMDVAESCDSDMLTAP